MHPRNQKSRALDVRCRKWSRPRFEPRATMVERKPRRSAHAHRRKTSACAIASVRRNRTSAWGRSEGGAPGRASALPVEGCPAWAPVSVRVELATACSFQDSFDFQMEMSSHAVQTARSSCADTCDAQMLDHASALVNSACGAATRDPRRFDRKMKMTDPGWAHSSRTWELAQEIRMSRTESS